MKVKIREAKLNELEEVAELKMKLDKYERKFDKIIKVCSKNCIATYLKKDVLEKRKGKIFIAKDEETNKIVGYCNGWIYKADWLQYKNVKLGYISDCFILKEYRRMGIARKLIGKMLKWFKSKKIRISYLEVYLKNKNAHNVWGRLDFKDLEINMRKMIR